MIVTGQSLKPSQIVIEARTPAAADDPVWKTSKNERCAPLITYLDRTVSVESFVGGQVNLIRVMAYRARLGRSIPTPLEIQQEILATWEGEFRTAACSINWSESADWTIRATVEFEDGTSSSLLTDGVRVQVQDRKGQYWFLRLLPAAQ